MYLGDTYYKLTGIDSTKYPMWAFNPLANVVLATAPDAYHIKLAVDSLETAKAVATYSSLIGGLNIENENLQIEVPSAIGEGTEIYNVKSLEGLKRRGVDVTKILIDNYGYDQSKIVDGGNAALLKEGDKILIPKDSVKPVDYSQVISEIMTVANGGDVKIFDVDIPQGVYVPRGSELSSYKDIYYQYTTKPSGGSFWSKALMLGEFLLCFTPIGAMGAVASFLGVTATQMATINAILSVLANNGRSALLSKVASFIEIGLSGYQAFKSIESLFSTLKNGPEKIGKLLTESTTLSCPLILDMDGNGVETLDIAGNSEGKSVYFNSNNSSFSFKTGWVSKDDALLVVDKDGNGTIDNQSELFGNETESGFSMLANYDTCQTSGEKGVINSKDAGFSNLKIWQDANEDGITDSGELKTLAEAGIVSINLPSDKNYQAYEQNQNIITNESTFTWNDTIHGNDTNPGGIYNVEFAINKLYTQYNGDYELRYDVIDMPWIRGYGQVMDLQLAMSQDTTLGTSLKNLVNELSKITDTKALYDRIDELLTKWTGTTYDDDDMSGGVSLKKVDILNKFLNLGITGNINADQKTFIDASYSELKNKTYVDFLAQTKLGDNFEIAYDYNTDAIFYNDNTYKNIVSNLRDQNNFFASYIITKVLGNSESLDIKKLAAAIREAGYGSALIAYLNSGFQLLNSGELAYIDPATPHYIIGSSGNDTINGTNQVDIIYGMDENDVLNGFNGDDYLNGGYGNDILNGADGSDTLDGGAGDDTLDGGADNDVYIYDGDGKDIVIDERWVKVATQVWEPRGFWIFLSYYNMPKESDRKNTSYLPFVKIK